MENPQGIRRNPLCRDVAAYEIIRKIGQGTFGEVFKAQERTTKKFVALKKILMENEKEGFPITALREIKILQKLKDENVVSLIEICSAPDPARKGLSNFFLAFEFCEHDLAGLLSCSSIKFLLGEIKMIMKQMLLGLYKIHSSNIIHRDIKASNILITKGGVVKIADFGLARAYSNATKAKRFTNRVVTLWYRPPELLLGERDYGPQIDMWGVGCLMSELWTRTPILQGQTEQHQLHLITQLCGSITPQTLPGVEKLELYTKMTLKEGQRRRVVERLKGYVRDRNAVDLIDKFMAMDPNRRIDCDHALNHDFFWTDPMPCDLSKMMSQINVSMFELTTQRKTQAQHPQQKARPTDDQYCDMVF